MKLRGAVSENKSRKGKVERGNNCALRISLTSDLWPLTPSRGMTLIELLVVIVILTTLVGGVLPLVSPNNDTRKISEATRSLQTYFMQAQAEAARVGRPVGVGFRESADGSGVALEVFQLTVPKPYPGVSSWSRVNVYPLSDPKDEPFFYGEGSVPATMNYPEFEGTQLYAVRSQLAVRDTQTGRPMDDSLPPGMFRVGDLVMAGSNQFMIVDDKRHTPMSTVNKMKFLNPSEQRLYPDTLFCVRMDQIRMQDNVQPLGVPRNGFDYSIHRQPMGYGVGERERVMTSSGSPLQLPSGIAIDMQASGRENSQGIQLFSHPITLPQMNPAGIDSMGIMFSPNGGVESVWVNGRKIVGDAKVFLLLGRQENGNPPEGLYKFSKLGQVGDMTDEEFKDVQSKVNWLNLDSRWLMLNGNDGRMTVNANAKVDPRFDPTLQSTSSVTARAAQIEAAHGLSHEHTAPGGTRGGTN